MQKAELRWHSLDDRPEDGMTLLQPDVVSADVEAVNLGEQNIVCIVGIQRAFLLYGIAHDVLDAQAAQKIYRMFGTHVVVACLFSEAGTARLYSV